VHTRAFSFPREQHFSGRLRDAAMISSFIVRDMKYLVQAMHLWQDAMAQKPKTRFRQKGSTTNSQSHPNFCLSSLMLLHGNN